MKKVSIKDIAASLKLSRNTVAKALADSESVSLDTRQKVVRKALEMGYAKLMPQLVQKMKEKKLDSTRNIAVLVHQADALEFWVRIVNGISGELARNHNNLVYCYVSEEDVLNLRIPPNISNHNVDGIIILHVFSMQYIEKLHEQNLPMVFLDAPASGTTSTLRGDIVLIEGETGICEITKHLIRQGRTHLGFIGDTTYCRTMYERWRGFQEAHREMDIALDLRVCFASKAEHRYYSYEDVSEALGKIKDMPQAIVCANDQIALHVYKYLQANGYSIPGDVAVSGFDDTRECCCMMDPHLTSVHVNNEEIGRRLAEELLWRLKGPDRPYETVRISWNVIFRESTPLPL